MRRWTMLCFALALVALLPMGFVQAQAVTPPSGSPERKGIMDAMRLRIGDDTAAKQVFVVRSLKMKDGWAWLIADPRSRNGKQKYETESALLRQDGTRWKVVDQVCSEEDCDTAAEIARIRKAYPAAPAAIFPK